jgi:hypothetical protein
VATLHPPKTAVGKDKESMIDYNRDLVIAKAKQCFPNEDQGKIMGILDLYHGPEKERVQISILKLSGGDLEDLRAEVESAKRDYRNVLAYAEFPEEMSEWAMSDKEEVNEEEEKRMRERDRQQYIDWLQEKV